MGHRRTAVCVYIDKVRGRIADLARAKQADELAKALASYEAIFARQMAAGHYGGARETLDSIVRLRGLAAPEQRAYESVVNLIQLPPDTPLP